MPFNKFLLGIFWLVIKEDTVHMHISFSHLGNWLSRLHVAINVMSTLTPSKTSFKRMEFWASTHVPSFAFQMQKEKVCHMIKLPYPQVIQPKRFSIGKGLKNIL